MTEQRNIVYFIQKYSILYIEQISENKRLQVFFSFRWYIDFTTINFTYFTLGRDLTVLSQVQKFLSVHMVVLRPTPGRITCSGKTSPTRETEGTNTCQDSLSTSIKVEK